MPGVVWKLKDTFSEEWFDSWLPRLSSIRDAGVRMVAGTDSGFSLRGVENRMDDYVSALEVLATAGWSSAAAIEAATILAAQACSAGTITGSLDPGKRADVIAVCGNPLTRFADLRQLQFVMVSGRQVTPVRGRHHASSGGLA